MYEGQLPPISGGPAEGKSGEHHRPLRASSRWSHRHLRHRFPDYFRYLDHRNVQLMLKAIPSLAIITLGVNLLMIAGEFDLTVGATFTLTALVMAKVFNAHMPLWPCRARGAGPRRGYRAPQRLHRGEDERSLVHRHPRERCGSGVAWSSSSPRRSRRASTRPISSPSSSRSTSARSRSSSSGLSSLRSSAGSFWRGTRSAISSSASAATGARRRRSA